MAHSFNPEDWGLSAAPSGELSLDGHSLVELARQFGTPLHVVCANRLRQTARGVLAAAQVAYPGKVSVHFALKCNWVPGVVEQIHEAGLSVEVTTSYELQLALRIGFAPSQIVVNGPGKPLAFLERCLEAKARLIVVDSLEELAQLSQLAKARSEPVSILLRINPGYTPEGMNKGNATASRHGSAFGLDLKGGEVETAFKALQGYGGLRFLGIHMHIGTGIRSPKAYSGALRCLPLLRKLAHELGQRIEVVDLGGGIASRTTRGMSTVELALYETFGRLPRFRLAKEMPKIEEFFAEIAASVRQAFQGETLPELIFEPGRCIASPNQFLLLTVLGVKKRPGVKTWITTDGGLSTVTMPTYYECHEVLLCNDVHRPRGQIVTLNGPACFAGDVIYRNMKMPELNPGEILSIMDTGAYFTALESSFGFQRPAIVLVDGDEVRPIRSRETLEDMVARDSFRPAGRNETPDAPARR